MNTKQEIVDAFDGRSTGELPPPAVFTQTGTVGQMCACGAGWPEAHYDPEKMATLALQFSKMFGFATARVPYCLTVEIERLGATIKEGSRDTQPSVIGTPYSSGDVAEPPSGGLMDPDEFASGGRCAMVAEVAERMSREHEDLFITAGMQDPMALTSQLLGAENMLMAGFMEPGKISKWIDAVTPLTCAYAEMLSEAADNVLVIAGGSTDMYSPEMLEEFSVPFTPRAISSIRSSFSTIHSCGDTLAFAGRLAGYGADALSLETFHCPEEYMRIVNGRCRMFGSIDPVGTLLMKRPEDVVASARRGAELGFDIITPECGVPPLTPDANLMALSHYRDRS